MKNLNSYTLGDDYVSPDKRLSQMLIQQGSSYRPSYSWQETAGRIAQQLLGNYIADEDQRNQNKAFDAMTGQEPDSYSLQPTMNDQQIMGSPAVQKILQKPNDAERMQNPNIQNNIKAIGYEQDRISEAEAMNQGINDKLGSFNSPADAQREIDFNNQSIAQANQNIDSYGDQFNRNMAFIRGGELTDDQRADRVRDQLIGQRNASMENTLNQKMNPRDYSMQQLRGLENNPYAKRILAQMMMQNADMDYERGLAQTARGFAQEDATTDFERKKELAQIKIDSAKTKEQRNFLQAQNDPQFKEFLAATGAGNTPNAVREYEYYMGLKTPEARQNFMNIKRGAKTINLADKVQVLDPTNPSGAPLSSYAKGVPPQQTPEHKASVKERETTAKSVAEARFNLPKIISTADRHLALLDRVTKTDPETGKRINHPGFKSLYGTAIPGIDGATAPFARFMPGSDTKDLSAIVEQIGGSNFLLAFESLKGGGQITELEGNQAKLAISALQDINISEQEAFRQYDTLRTILAKGVENAKAQAGEYDMTLTNTPDGNNQKRRSTDTQERRSTDIPEGVSKEQWGVMSLEQKALFK